MKPHQRNVGIVSALVALLAVVCLAPAVASAAFTRPFLRQIARAENAPHPVAQPCSEADRVAAGSACVNPGGVGVDSEDHLWVGSSTGLDGEPPLTLDEFGTAYAPGENSFIRSFPVATEPGSVAVQSAVTGNGDIYVSNPGTSQNPVEVFTPAGVHVESWGDFDDPYVAVDNNGSTDVGDASRCGLAECTVYVSEKQGVHRFTSKGVEVSFVAKESYVKGGEITGRPAGLGCGEVFGPSTGVHAEAVAVDASGDIFVVVSECKSVFEYRASGEYVRAFDVETAPRFGPGRTDWLAGGGCGGWCERASAGVECRRAAGKGGVGVGSVGVVDEFSLESGGFVDELTTDGEGGELQRPAALAVDSRGDVYVADQEARVVDVWGAGAYFPSVVLGEAAARTATGARLEGTVNPAQGENENKAPVTECYFQYIPEAEYEVALAKKEAGGFPKGRAAEAQCSPDASEISLTLEPEAEHPVQGQAVGLRAGVPYRYRLVAVTQEGSLTKGGLAASAAAAFTPPAPPKIVSSSAGNVSSAFADLHAQIDPAGAATSYRFEYDTRPYSSEGEAAHGVSVPVPDATVGAGGPTGSGVESVVQHAVGLTPATTYYFRVVAVNEVDTSEETAQSKGSFTTLPAVHGLPDSRGYELVTPADQAGRQRHVRRTRGRRANSRIRMMLVRAAEDGEGFLLETDSEFGEFPFAFASGYVFKRGRGRAGMVVHVAGVARSLEAQDAANSVIFDPVDLSRVAVNDAVRVNEARKGRG